MLRTPTRAVLLPTAVVIAGLAASLAACRSAHPNPARVTEPVKPAASKLDPNSPQATADSSASPSGAANSAPVAIDRKPIPPGHPALQKLEPFRLAIPGSTSALEMLAIPWGGFTAVDGARHEVGPLWMSSTEVPWEIYDAYVFAMDRAEGEKDPPDAWTRPTKPYILMDRGYGHQGYPAISVSHKGATEFCKWLSMKSGRTVRLPKPEEWEWAARALVAGDYGVEATKLGDHAWFDANSEMKTHPIGTKQPNAFGLFDMHGNACEWTTGPDGKGWLRGGSFEDAPDLLKLSNVRANEKKLNKTDPQIPRSVWWLADGRHVGFRVVCVP